jgi:hypothetical protein
MVLVTVDVGRAVGEDVGGCSATVGEGSAGVEISHDNLWAMKEVCASVSAARILIATPTSSNSSTIRRRIIWISDGGFW